MGASGNIAAHPSIDLWSFPNDPPLTYWQSFKAYRPVPADGLERVQNP